MMALLSLWMMMQYCWNLLPQDDHCVAELKEMVDDKDVVAVGSYYLLKNGPFLV